MGQVTYVKRQVSLKVNGVSVKSVELRRSLVAGQPAGPLELVVDVCSSQAPSNSVMYSLGKFTLTESFVPGTTPLVLEIREIATWRPITLRELINFLHSLVGD